MLGKLFKHDMRTLSRPLRFVVLGIICLALLAAFCLAIEVRQADSYANEWNDDYTRMLQSTMAYTGMIVLLALGMGAGIAVIAVFIFVHYYRSMFSDEGYLTHTLPVKSWEILLSKVLSAAVWMIIGAVSIVLGIFIILLLGTSGDTLFNTQILLDIGGMFDNLREAGALGTTLLILPELLTNMLAGMLQIYLAITIGCAIANRHRVWAAIGVYVAIGVCNNIINTAFTVPSIISMVSQMYESPSLSAINGVLAVDIIKNSAIAAGCFFWIKYLLKRKLNLQ